METPSTSRRHDLDWLRFIAIIILLFFHTGMWFNEWGWHVKNSQTSIYFNYWMAWLHYWRMPLLLFISGAGTYMALEKRTYIQFVRERFTRLFIPLIVGMLIVVPPQIYYEHINEYSGYWDFYKTVFHFVPYPKGSLSWHHLWFILYLFLYSLIGLPLLNYLRSPKSLPFRERAFRWLSGPAGLLGIPSTLILLSQILLRPYFPEETHNLVQDGAYFVFYFLFFLFGMLCYSNAQLWEAIGQNRNYFLIAAGLILIPFYGIYFSFREWYALPCTPDTLETVFDITSIYLSWFTVIAVIAYGQHFLNRPHPWLSRINEGLYPFYILHQTVIIVIGYYICQLDWSISAKFWSISLLTLLFCIAFYLLLIRPINLLRLFFGVKQKSKK